MKQVQEVLDRHKGEAGIIYCIRRKDVDAMTAQLKRLGYKALPYHAGMEAMERRVGWESDKGDPIRWFLFYFRGSKSNMAEKGDSYSTLGAKSRIRPREALLGRIAFGFGAEMNRG